MMWWSNGTGWGGWVMMTLAMVAFWSLVVFGVAAMFRRDGDSGFGQAGEHDPMQILDERFARGEIGVDEYQSRRGALRVMHR